MHSVARVKRGARDAIFAETSSTYQVRGTAAQQRRSQEHHHHLNLHLSLCTRQQTELNCTPAVKYPVFWLIAQSTINRRFVKLMMEK